METKKLTVDISLVLPTYNEEESIPLLYETIKPIMEAMNRSYEIIFIDDGSTDNTISLLHQLRKQDRTLKIIKFRRNYGQTPAMSAGFDYAQGDIIIPMDADLQNDPKDIPRLIAKMEEGYDIVSGWRKHRRDKALTRKLPSMIANKIISKFTGVRIHDYGCTLKAYRGSVVKSMHLYSDMHRFLPAMGLLTGAKVVEMPVTHHARRFGISKYGISRTGKVIVDLLTIKLITSFSLKPMYLFGGAALIALFFAIIFTIVSICQYAWYSTESFYRLSLWTTGFLFWWLSTSLISIGFLCECVVKTSQWRRGRLQKVLAEYIEQEVEI